MPRSLSRPIRVVHLVTSLETGGLERVVTDLARLSDPNRVTAHVICLESGGMMVAEIERAGVPCEVMRAREMTRRARVLHLARRLRACRADILHTHNPGPHVHGVLARLLAGTPVLVHTKHGRNYPDNCWAVRANRAAAMLTSRIVAVSEDALRVAVDIERVPAAKVLRIVNGIDLDAFPPVPLDRAPRWSAVHVGRLDLAKDQTTLLRAARLVANVVPEFRLDLVGDGPLRPALTQLADALDLGAHVRFAGAQANVQPWLASARLFILSSITEGTPLTLLEAMATGRAAVATAVGGNAEVVEAGVTGVIVPPRAPRALADAVVSLLRDDERLSHLGAEARTRAEQRYSAVEMARRYTGVYEAALQARARRGAGRLLPRPRPAGVCERIAPDPASFSVMERAGLQGLRRSDQERV